MLGDILLAENHLVIAANKSHWHNKKVFLVEMLVQVIEKSMLHMICGCKMHGKHHI